MVITLDIGKLKNKIYNDIITELQKITEIEGIIVHGSWGKNEVSYVTDITPTPLILSDMELIAYPRKKSLIRRLLLKQRFKQVEKTLSAKYALKIEIGQTFPQEICIDNTNWTLHEFDMKWASENIYGEDITRNIFPISPKGIPLWEGYKLVFNRMAELSKLILLVQTQEENSKDPLLSLYLRRANDKLLLALQAFLLISSKKYVSSSSMVQYKLVKTLCTKEYKEIFEKCSTFIRAVREALDRVINGYSSRRDKISLPELKETGELADELIRAVTLKTLGITFRDYSELQENLLTIFWPKNLIIKNLCNTLKILAFSGMKIHAPLILKSVQLDIKKVVITTIPVIYFDTVLSRGDVDLYIKNSKLYKQIYAKLINQAQNSKREIVFKILVIDMWEKLT